MSQSYAIVMEFVYVKVYIYNFNLISQVSVRAKVCPWEPVILIEKIYELSPFYNVCKYDKYVPFLTNLYL